VWNGLGRPGTANLRLTVWPTGPEPPATAGQISVSRPHVRIAAGWPAR
jgi:hypothetical protein